MLLAAVIVAGIGGAAFAVVQRVSPAPGSSDAVNASHRAAKASRRRNHATTSTIYGLTGVAYDRGDCVIWEQTPAQDHRTHRVSCSEPHLIEVSGRVDVTGRFRQYPTEAELDKKVFNTDCAAQVEALMGHTLDPDGRFSAGGIYPSEPGWRDGDHTVWCGAIGRSLTRLKYPWELLQFRGRVEGANQTLLQPIGSCWSATSSGYQQSCARAHDFEISGYVDLTGRTSQPPAENDNTGWLNILGDRCRNAARDYLQRDLPDIISAGYLPISSASWAAGRRTVECTVERFQNGKPLPTTGSLRP